MGKAGDQDLVIGFCGRQKAGAIAADLGGGGIAPMEIGVISNHLTIRALGARQPAVLKQQSWPECCKLGRNWPPGTKAGGDQE
jgi:hypothetical protein